MLKVLIKDVIDLLSTPGIWIVSFIVNVFNLAADFVTFRFFGVFGDILLILASVLFYHLSKRSKK